jgi:hypothetical protein
MASKPNFLTTKKIILILTMAAVIVVYYFVVYAFCRFLIEQGLIAAFTEGPRNFLADRVVSGRETASSSAVNFLADTSVGISSEPSGENIVSSSSDVAAVVLTSTAIVPSSSSAVSEDQSNYQSDVLPNISDPSLFFGSHFDTFANSEYIDIGQTTFYYDEAATAYYLPPDYLFQEAAALDSGSQESLNNVHLNMFQGFYEDERCLGDSCLTQKGEELFFNGEKLSLPPELSGLNLAALSIGSLTKRWLVGFTVKRADNYEGIAYYFDGQSFSRIFTPELVISPYFGVFGFGGGENNFLLIYGAYQGIAYHFQGNEVFDISRFFDIRVMNGGFKPEVIFTAFESNVNWYVYSSSTYTPVLIKLWQNRSSEIVGEAVLNDIFQKRDESAVFKLSSVGNEAITLSAKLRRNNRDSWFSFVDRGFKIGEAGVLVSVPLAHDGYSSVIDIVMIAVSRVSLDATSAGQAKFFVSADSQKWLGLENKTNYDLNLPTNSHFFLKVAVPASNDKFYSPFISEILFDYYCRK